MIRQYSRLLNLYEMMSEVKLVGMVIRQYSRMVNFYGRLAGDRSGFPGCISQDRAKE